MFRRQESYEHNLLLERSRLRVAKIKLKVSELGKETQGTTMDQGDLSFMRLVVKNCQQEGWIKNKNKKSSKFLWIPMNY